MKQVCLLCGRISTDGNLWCQEFDCPAEEKPVIFDYGQFLGDIKISRMLRVTRAAAFYEAERVDGTLLIKVAHPRTENHLKREAEILRQLQSSHPKPSHPVLPVLLPAYHPSSLSKHPYGKAVVAGEERFFEVFQHLEGEFLQDMLIKNPLPWYEHAAWLMMSLADVFAYLHSNVQRLHLALSPETVMIRTDKEGIPRPTLLDLGLMVKETKPEHLQWLHYHSWPAYTAPELTYTTPDTIDDCTPASPASDVYGLGILLYEMLAGHPAFEYQRKRHDQVREAVRSHRPAGIMRTDLPEAIHKVVDRAIDKSPHERHEHIASFAEDLHRYFGQVPVEKKRRTALQTLVLVAIILVAVLSLVVLLFTLFG
jgi:serine/threonine protein kinase